MYRLITISTLIASICCAEDDSWIKQAANRSDQEAVKWVKQHLMENSIKQAVQSSILNTNINEKDECQNCSSDFQDMFPNPQVFVYMSFSIPDETWISISRELEKVGGIFVVRGLPKQSFKELVAKILSLKQKEINAPIQLDPKKFQEYQITSVPVFVVEEEKIYDKVMGNVSLKFALEMMAKKGETLAAKQLVKMIN